MALPTDPAQLAAVLNGPAIPPPPGVTPHPGSTDVPNLNRAFIGTAVVCFSLSTFLVAVRTYTRVLVIRKTDASDYLTLLTYGAFIALTGLLVKFVREGGGRHTWDIRLIDLGTINYWFLMAAMAYDITMILIKSAILVQYRSIFNPTKAKGFIWWSTWILTTIVWIFYITTGLIQIFFCTPVHKTWNPLIPGKCIDSNSGQLNVIASAFNVAIDSIILILPLVSISRLHLIRKRRLAIGSFFLVGIFACLSAAFRTYYSYLLQSRPDAIFNAMRLGFWAYAETTSGIIIACMPIIPRFVQQTIGESLIYGRIATSVRNLATAFSRSSRSRSYNRQDSLRRSSEGSLKGAGAVKVGVDEVELKPQQHLHNVNGILRTVDIHSSRE